MVTSSPESVELTGPPGAVAFPSICARCAAPSAGFVAVEKVFTRSDSDGPTESFCQAINVPFCAACTLRHRAERPPMPIDKRVFQMFRSEKFWSGLGPLAFAMFLSWLVLKFLLRAELLGAGLLFGLAALFWAMAAFLIRSAWWDSHRITVQPPSSVTAAFDYSDDRRQLFEPEHHLYTMQNSVFSAAFVELNRSRIWRPDSRTARVAERKRNLLLKVVLVLAGLFFVYELLDDFGLVPFK